MDLKITFTNYIRIHNVEKLPAVLIEMLRSVGRWKNPDYYRNRALKLSNFKTPMEIKARGMLVVGQYQRDLVYERGLWEQISQVFNEYSLIASKNDKLPTIRLNCSTHGLEDNFIADFPEFQLRLEEYQLSSMREVLDIQAPHQGIISYPPGGGKTIAAAYLIRHRQRRTLIVVHTAALASQWENALTNKCFKNTKLSISTVNGRKKDFSGKHIVIATVQTLSKLIGDDEKYTDKIPECLKGFGCVILDECHHVAASTFLNVIGRCPARFRYGLSASLKRRDGKQFLMRAVFGRVLVKLGYKDIVDRLSLPSVCKISVPEPRGWEPKIIYKVRGSKKNDDLEEFLDYAALFRWFSMSLERNRILQGVIDECISSPSNYTLVLVKLRDHAQMLYEYYKDKVPSALLMGGGSASYQKEKEEILKKANNGDIKLIFGTSIADEGLDIARLNRLVLTSPTSFDEILRQRIGRIARALPNKEAPVVFDIVDEYIPELHDSWMSRLHFYNSLEMEVTGDDNLETL